MGSLRECTNDLMAYSYFMVGNDPGYTGLLERPSQRRNIT